MPGIRFTLKISNEEPNDHGEVIYEVTGETGFQELIMYGPEADVLRALVPNIKNLCLANHGFEATVFELHRPDGSTEDMTEWTTLPLGKHQIRVW